MHYPEIETSITSRAAIGCVNHCPTVPVPFGQMHLLAEKASKPIQMDCIFGLKLYKVNTLVSDEFPNIINSKFAS
jgi:hypothetical protein